MADPVPQISERRIHESSALLMLWSFFALVEGTMRTTSNTRPNNNSNSSETVVDGYFDTANGTQIPVFVLLLAAVIEVCFSMLGFLVGFYASVFRYNSLGLTKLFVTIQATLGWFVFITYVLAEPIKAAVSAEGISGLLSGPQQSVIMILGNLLGSFTFCCALQGGHFIMAMRLMDALMGQPELRNKNKFRALMWIGNLFLAAASTLYVGISLASKEFSSITGPVGAPPHLVWFPTLSILTGMTMAAFGVVTLIGVYYKPLVVGTTQILPITWIGTTLVMMANFSWSFGIVPGAPPDPRAAIHLGLVLAVTILPMYHVYRTHHLVDGEDESAQKKLLALGKDESICKKATTDATSPPEKYDV